MRALLSLLFALLLPALAAAQSVPSPVLDLKNSTVKGPDVAAVSRLIKDRMADWSSAADFANINFTNSSDSTAGVQAAIAAKCARTSGRGGGTLYFPEGKIRLNAAISNVVTCPGLHIVCSGWGDRDKDAAATTFTIFGSGSAPIFRWAAPISQASRYALGGGIHGCGFNFSNPDGNIAQLGPAFRFELCQGCIAENNFLWNPYRVGVVYGGYMNRITGNQAEGIALGGEAILGYGSDAGTVCQATPGACATRSDLLGIDHNSFYSSTYYSDTSQKTATCIHLQDFMATTAIYRNICNQSNIGIKADCPNSTAISNCPQFITCVDCEVESNGAYGGAGNAAAISLDDVQEFNCVGCLLYGYSTTDLVKLGKASRFSGATGIKFVGGKASSAGHNIFDIWQSHVLISGMDIHDANKNNDGGNGVEVHASTLSASAANTGSVKIVDNDFCEFAAGTPHTMAGVVIGPLVDYSTVQGNSFRNCSTGVTNNASDRSHNSITDNVGP